MFVVLIYRLVQIMFLFDDAYFGFFLKLGRLLGFESLFWHGKAPGGGRNDLSQRPATVVREIKRGGWIPIDYTITNNCFNIVALQNFALLRLCGFLPGL